MVEERRKLARRNFTYYMRVLDEASGKVVGYISDISTGGFKLDSKYSVPLNVNLRLRIEQTGSISSKSFIIFTGKARWCRQDRLDPSMYNVGLQIVDMSPADLGVVVEMFNAYGTKQEKSSKDDDSDYLWR